MAEEEKKQEEITEQKDEAQEEKTESEEKEVNQEDLAKEWEEALRQQQASNSYNQEEQSQEELAKQWEEALKEQESKSTLKEVKSPETPSEGKCEKEFELLRDIPLEVSVEVGSTKLPLEEILKLHTNSVVELDRFIDEPVDIKINGKLVAKGKLYQVEENFGVEIVQIITPEERLKLIEE